jgi:UDP-3-O-[3-hydroxymyristoyl] N-acetylglucosamine deacetylase
VRKQRTLKEPIKASGVGLHTGRKVEIKLEAARENSGIIFYREDKDIEIELSPESVVDTQLATTIGKDGVVIKTVEHLLSTLFALHIDNVYITLKGEEIPIMDGSSAPWVYLIKTAGIIEQDAYKKTIIVKKPISIREDGKFAALIPAKDFEISYSINFNNSFIGKQRLDMVVNEQTFVKEISKARTFGFLKDIEYLQSHNLALGGSLDNAVVVDEYGIVNEDPLRYEDEFVRHKILDAIGDLSILGMDIKGRYIAYKSGHNLNNRLLRKLFSDRASYEIAVNPARERAIGSFVWQGAAT